MTASAQVVCTPGRAMCTDSGCFRSVFQASACHDTLSAVRGSAAVERQVNVSPGTVEVGV